MNTSKWKEFAFFFLTVCCLAFACKKKKPVAETDLPLSLKTIIAQRSNDCGACPQYIDKYVWRGQQIYTLSCNGPACLCTTLYYRANGDTMMMPQGYLPVDFANEATSRQNIWTCGK